MGYDSTALYHIYFHFRIIFTVLLVKLPFCLMIWKCLLWLLLILNILKSNDRPRRRAVPIYRQKWLPSKFYSSPITNDQNTYFQIECFVKGAAAPGRRDWAQGQDWYTDLQGGRPRWRRKQRCSKSLESWHSPIYNHTCVTNRSGPKLLRWRPLYYGKRHLPANRELGPLLQSTSGPTNDWADHRRTEINSWKSDNRPR